MVKQTLAVVLLAALVTAASAEAAGHGVLARFDGGIGVDPVSSVASPILVVTPGSETFENVTRNFVRGVRSSFAIWRIADLRAEVSTDGRVQAIGHGLVLGGGDRIGQSLGLKVFATLICEAEAPFVELNSADLTTADFVGAVPLDANGDFRIDGTLRSPLGDPVPSVCDSPTLLIRAATNRTWLAVAIPHREKN